MKRRGMVQQQRENARDLALAFLGSLDATEVYLRGVIARHIERVIAATDGNLSLAAKLLGLNRRSLQRYKRRRDRPHARRR